MLNASLPHPAFDLLVIGGASLDAYHLVDGQIVHSPGGAGLYTALAAHKAGAHAGMFAPRPEPLSDELQPAAERLAWIGPTVPPDQLPHFEIAHYGGGRAALLNASWGGEMLITPENFPNDTSARIIHIAALRTAERQLNFAKTLIAKRPSGEPQFPITNYQFRLSAGTYGKVCASEPDTVRELINLCDFFFMNENEATLLFGGVDSAAARAGQVIFITLSERGALVLQGDHATRIPGHPVAEFDPTGAGDTFCGATLAHLARGEHPIRAAQAAVMLAAEMIGAVGPTRLLAAAPAPRPALDPCVRVDATQVERVAQLIVQLPEVQPFSFIGDLFPPIGHPRALDFFFAATLQQFGFWEMTPHLPTAPLLNHPSTSLRPAQDAIQGKGKQLPEVKVYSHPLIAPIAGRSLKGSDYLFAAYRRILEQDTGFFTPERQAALSEAELAGVLRADDGSSPMPAFDLHLEMARSYGRDMQALGWTPQLLSNWANCSANPRATFLSLLDHVGGYKEDPLRKKAMLLALMLEQRPEQFLRPSLASLRATQERSNLPVDVEIASQKDARNDAEPAVIDYHLMRSCLRTGLVEVIDADLRGKLIEREELSEQEEWAVRFAAYQAIQQVQVQSGRSMGAVDWFFFNARRRCPEMTEPECVQCAIDPACAHRTELFQPVRRTTFY